MLFDRFALTDDRQRALFFEMSSLAARNSDVRHATREYYNGLVATFEEPSGREAAALVQTQAEPHTLALLRVALYSGLQNYEMVWRSTRTKGLWLTGMKILRNRPYNGSYGEENELGGFLPGIRVAWY